MMSRKELCSTVVQGIITHVSRKEMKDNTEQWRWGIVQVKQIYSFVSGNTQKWLESFSWDSTTYVVALIMVVEKDQMGENVCMYVWMNLSHSRSRVFLYIVALAAVVNIGILTTPWLSVHQCFVFSECPAKINETCSLHKLLCPESNSLCFT